MTKEERNKVLDEAAKVARTVHVNNGDHYASCYGPSPDGELIAEAIEDLKTVSQ